MEQLAGREVHRHGAPGAALVRMGDRRLLGRHADQPVHVVVEAQGDRHAAHHAAVAGGVGGTLLPGALPRFERLHTALDQLQRAPRLHADAAAVHLHPLHPTLGDVAGVEIAALDQRLAEQQGHRRVIVVRGAFGRRGRIHRTSGERGLNRFRCAVGLRRHTELVAGDEPQQRRARARDDAGVGMGCGHQPKASARAPSAR